MKLSDGEKLIILLLSELYEKLDVKGEMDAGFIKSAIAGDQTWGIRWKYPGIPFDEATDPTVVREVVDILDMWSFIEHSYGRLTDEQKSELEERVGDFGKNPRFAGFDGNNETDHMATAIFLVNDLERFEVFKGRSLNCHHPSLEMHFRMLEKFNPIRSKLSFDPPSVDQIASVLEAQPYPG